MDTHKKQIFSQKDDIRLKQGKCLGGGGGGDGGLPIHFLLSEYLSY